VAPSRFLQASGAESITAMGGTHFGGWIGERLTRDGPPWWHRSGGDEPLALGWARGGQRRMMGQRAVRG
jgi:hypothetical protein